MAEEQWFPAETCPFAANDAVQVWRISLELNENQLNRARAVLATDEKKRADRFYFEKDKNHFIAARAQLRFILGKYLGYAPAALQFEYNPQGKPHLAGPLRGQLFFNLSHSHKMGLIALHSQFEVGIDIEWMRREVSGIKIAERFFSPYELEQLKALDKQDQMKGFFNCWTRKEAYIKARGKGLSIPLNQFDVSLNPEEPARILAIRHDPKALNEWTLHSLDPGENYAAAVVAHSEFWKMVCWDGLNSDFLLT